MEKGNLRRIDRAVTIDEAKNQLRTGVYGILSTASIDGQPYGIPINYCYADDVIYFHSALEGHKIDNISDNNRVSFCVTGNVEILSEQFATKYESVIVFGKVSEVFGHEKHTALIHLLLKYSPSFMEQGFKYIEDAGGKARTFKISVDSITGKSRK